MNCLLNPKFKIQNPKLGFTLIEALVSSVLMGAGIAGLIGAGTLSVRNERKIEQRSAALWLAKEKISDVETVGPHIWSLGHPTKGTERLAEVDFDWNLEINRLAAGELYDVQVTVTWSHSTGQGSVELETWLNDYPAASAIELQQHSKP